MNEPFCYSQECCHRKINLDCLAHDTQIRYIRGIMDIPQLKLRPLHRSSLITANKTRQTPAMPKRVAGGWWPAEDDRPSARICSIGSSCASPCGRPRRTPKGAFSDKIKNSSTAIVAQRRRVASLRRRPSVCISFFGDLTSARYSVANFGGTEFRLRLLHLPGSISTDGSEKRCHSLYTEDTR